MLKEIRYDNNLKEIMEGLNSRKEGTNKKVDESVEEILKNVRENGDKALIEYAKKFDGFEIKNIEEIIASKEEIENGANLVGENFMRILNRTKKTNN